MIPDLKLQRQFMVLLFLSQASSLNTQSCLRIFFSDLLSVQYLVSPALLYIVLPLSLSLNLYLELS